VLRVNRLRRPVALGVAVVAFAAACTNASPDAQDSASVKLGTTAPSESAMTDVPSAEKESYERFLAEQARAFGIDDPPAVEVVRTVDPLEQGYVWLDCMNDAGFASGSGGSLSAGTPDQAENFFLAQYTCFAQYPIDDRAFKPLTDSQWLFIRQYQIETAIPCLADLGYDVPQPPSPETYVGTVNTPEQYTLSDEVRNLIMGSIAPGASVNLGETRTSEVMAQCPEQPPASDVWQH